MRWQLNIISSIYELPILTSKLMSEVVQVQMVDFDFEGNFLNFS